MRRTDHRAHLTSQQRRRRVIAERLWIVAGVLYAVGRIWVAKATVEDHGVDIRLFALLEVGLAWPHALSSARVVEAFIDRDARRGMFWAAVFGVTHVAPELQIAIQGEDLPLYVWLTIAVIIFGIGGVSVYGLVKQIRAGRAARASAVEHPPAEAPDQALETSRAGAEEPDARSVATPANPRK